MLKPLALSWVRSCLMLHSLAAAGADRSLSFRAPLGNADVQTIRLKHLLADKAEDKVTVDGADFIVDSAAVSAPAAGERPPAGVSCGDFTHHFLSPASEDAGVSVDVRFESTGFGERNGRLVLPSLRRETSYAFSRAAPSPLALHAQSQTWSDYAVVAVTLPSRTFTPRPQRLPSRVTSVPLRAPTKAANSHQKSIKPYLSRSRCQHPARLQSASCR